jgi:hypothetical protein
MFISAVSVRVICPVYISCPILMAFQNNINVKHTQLSLVKVIESRALIAGEGGTPATGRRSV